VGECRSIRAAVSNMYKLNECVYVWACVGVGARVSDCRSIRAALASSYLCKSNVCVCVRVCVQVHSGKQSQAAPI
jgi:hypothetical protein